MLSIFMNPWMGFGLAAVSIPILIHLLNRQRYRTVEWAAMEFLLKAIKQNARKLQLRDIILMLIRAAAVLCFVLALMRPVVCSYSLGGILGKPTVRIVVVDISGSMDANDGGKTVLQKTVEAVRAMAHGSGGLDAKAQSVLLTTPSDGAVELPDGTADTNTFDGHLAALKQSGGTANFSRVMQRVKDMIHGRFKNDSVEIYLFSDMQQNGWKLEDKDLAANMRDIASHGHIYMVDVGKPPQKNVSIESFKSTDDTVLVGYDIPFVATLKNNGVQQADVDTTAELLVDGQVKYQQVVTLKPGQSQTLTFSVHPDTPGEHRVTLKLSPDNLESDNQASRILLAEDKMRVLIVDGNPRDIGHDSAGLFLKKVYTTTDLDLAALASADPKSATALQEKNNLSIARIGEGEWADQNLADAQLICLAGVPSIPPGMGAKLKRFVARGGGLMIFPGENIDIASYQKELGVAPPLPVTADPASAGQPAAPISDDDLSLLPCTYTEWWGEIPDPKSLTPVKFERISSKDVSHPIMLPFGQSPEYQQLLANVKIYRGLDMKLVAQDSPDIGIVARLNSGKLLAAIRSVGSGQVLMWSSACDTTSSNLPWFYAYYILMERSAEYLTIGSHPPLNLLAGDDLIHPVGDLDKGAFYRMTDAFGRKETMPAPYQRGSRWVVSPPDPVLYPGYIRIEKGVSAAATGPDAAADDAATPPLVGAAGARTDYAVSPLPDEFTLSYWPENAFHAGLPGVDFTYLTGSKKLAEALVTGSQGIELWWFFLLLVFALLALESYLVILWKPGSALDDAAVQKSGFGMLKSGFGVAGRVGQTKLSQTTAPEPAETGAGT
ncbi:MAG: BatA domain-containing protein [Planctomycetota bacterium]